MDKLLSKNLEGVIDDRQFKVMNSNYSERLNILSDQLADIEIKMNKYEDKEDKLKKFKRDIKEIADYKNKTTEEKRYLLLNLIDKIIVYENGEIDIHYKFEGIESQ